MTLDDSPQEAAWRAKVRAWITDNAPDLSGYSGDDLRVWSATHKALARAWQATKADAGYAALSWPTEWGGADGSAIEEAIFNQEELRAGLRFTYFMVGLQMLIPAMLRFNTDVPSRGMAAPALRGDTIWCQLFSELSSGSDSAATRTIAVREGGDWIVNGQKVWNSGAHGADYGMVITRTDPAVPKHKGLTVFWVKMDMPELEVRPIRMMSGNYGPAPLARRD